MIEDARIMPLLLLEVAKGEVDLYKEASWCIRPRGRLGEGH